MGKQEKNRSQKKKHVKRLRELARGLGKTKEEEALTNMRICLESCNYAGMRKSLLICLKSKKIKSKMVKAELAAICKAYSPSLLQSLKDLLSKRFSILKKYANVIKTLAAIMGVLATIMGSLADIVEAIRKIYD